jgi:hypothetical protein
VSKGRTGLDVLYVEGMARYSVIKNPEGRNRKGGYALHDSSPSPVFGEDVEGYGWVSFDPPRAGSSVICWFRRKRDALAHAAVLNGALRI